MVFHAANPFSPPSRGRAGPRLRVRLQHQPHNSQHLHKLPPFCFAKLSRPGLFSCAFIGLFPCREAVVRGERVCFSVHRASNLLFEVVCQNHIPASASKPSRGEAEIRNQSRGLILLNWLSSLPCARAELTQGLRRPLHLHI